MTKLADIFASQPEAVQNGIRDLGWSEPTPVQEKVPWPIRIVPKIQAVVNGGSATQRG